MIAEAGLATLWLAAALALLQAFWGLSLAVRRDDGADIARPVRSLAVVQALLVLLAFGLLVWLFLRTDLSVALVVANSHVDKPWLYKFAGAWGNHEGSMLLWVAILAASGALIASFERRLGDRMVAVTLGMQALLGLGFFAFLLFASNPFARLVPVARSGQGLNPLLQDPGLAFHPPTLYLGYVGLSVAFSFAVAALLLREVGPAMARAMRPWVLGAWLFLTLGIAAGSYWAYYELGWGGWWFWDPVENASLLPWLAATALLHSVAVLANRDALRSWTIILSLLAFSMSMLGTFLVRSGILTSVHAFAVDPQRGSFILALLTLYTGGAFILFGLRIGTVRQGKIFAPLSREGGLVLNNILLSVILAIVLFGTLYPLLAEALSGTKLSVGPPYFNAVTVPLALVLVAALMAGPLLRWRRGIGSGFLKKLAAPALVTILVAGWFALMTDAGWMPVAALGLAAGLALASVLPLVGRKLSRTPLAVYGMVIAHLGVAVAIAGMASESAFNREKLTGLEVGESVKFDDWTVKLEAVRPVLGPNWTAIEAELHLSQNGEAPVVMRTQNRTFFTPLNRTSEAAIETKWDGQFYAVLAGADDGDSASSQWRFRFWWKPFVTLIWFGGLLMGLGGAISLFGRLPKGVWRRWLPRRREGYADA